MKFTILSCSLRENSRSQRLAEQADGLLRSYGHVSEIFEAKKYPLEPFDDLKVYGGQNFEALYNAIKCADGVFIAAPVYNWSLGSVAKNIIEATGATGAGGRQSAWFDQVVTFLCSGGLPHSYMAYGNLALSLMLDFKCVVNPYVVYSTDRDWDSEGKLSENLTARLRKTVEVKIELSHALRDRRYSSGWEV
ncbi:MAG: NADPH-dependent FMN reductase [Phyllobacterium sp.]